MKFNYQARTKSGEIQTGTVEAFSKDTAINILHSAGLYVTFLEEATAPFYARRIEIFEKISKKEIVAFFRQMAIMFKSEIPLLEILSTLAKQTKKPTFREKIYQMAEKIESGNSLSKTFSAFPKIFNPFYINMIKSGEASGKLSEVFEYLADYIEKEYYFSSKVRGAMIYPIFVLFVFSIVLSVILFWILPQTATIIIQSNVKPPFLTQVLLGLATFLKKYALILFFAFIIGLSLLIVFLKTKEGKTFFDKIFLKIPVLNDFLKKIYLSRIALNLSTLISGGLPIVQSLEIVSEVVGNEVYKKIILETAEGVKRGERMSVLFERYPKEITPLFVQIVVVGEKTGRIDLSLTNVVDFYQKEVERALENLMRLLEPLIIIFLGLLVGLLVASVIVPIYQITTQAQSSF